MHGAMHKAMHGALPSKIILQPMCVDESSPEGARSVHNSPASPESPPAEQNSWRSRFVLAARRRCPTVTLLGSGDVSQMRLVADACAALDAGAAPTLVDDGLGGTYFVRRPNGEQTCVFKPMDEEPCALNNPKASQQPHVAGLGCSGLRSGILIGEAALNECLAYALDSTERARHFCQVPTTASVRTEHVAFFDSMSGEGSSYDEALQSPFRIRKEKVGSLQRYVAHEGCADDFSFSMFSTLEVQRIAVLDIRTFNTDRHGGNILVCRDPTDASRLTLTPIDHGFCFPEAPMEPAFEWRHWPQARAPLEPAVIEYISRIDVLADAALLRAESRTSCAESGGGGGGGEARAGSVREGCVRTMRVGTLLLQLAAREGLALADMAELMCEPCDEVWAFLGGGRAACEPRADAFHATLVGELSVKGGGMQQARPSEGSAAEGSHRGRPLDGSGGWGGAGSGERRRRPGGTALQRLCQQAEAETLQRVYYTGMRLRKQLSASERNALNEATFYEILQRRTQVFIAAFKHSMSSAGARGSPQGRRHPSLCVAIPARGSDGFDPSPTSTMDF